MHQCKLSEHDRHTCPEALTPCLSAGYGCTEVMRRKEITGHIQHCPASNVVCQFSHQRTEPSGVKAIEVPHVPSFSEEDELIDQKFLEGDLNVWEKERLEVTANSEKRTFPLPHWIEKIANKKAAGGVAAIQPEAYLEPNETGDLSPPDLTLETNVGLMTKGYWVAKRLFTPEVLILHKRTCIDTRVTVKEDSYYTTKVLPHNRRCCVFTCSEVVRRDEFSSHWKTLHLDIQLSDLVRRCPMHVYGCQYGVLDIAPRPKGSVLDYNKETDCFLYKPPSVTLETATDTSSSQYAAEIQKKQELALYGYEDVEEESFDVLGQLPAEVLMVICGFLDSQSLWALSQVNHYLRKVCLNLVKRAGIVYQDWERDSSGSWVPGPMVRQLFVSILSVYILLSYTSVSFILSVYIFCLSVYTFILSVYTSV